MEYATKKGGSPGPSPDKSHNQRGGGASSMMENTHHHHGLTPQTIAHLIKIKRKYSKEFMKISFHLNFKHLMFRGKIDSDIVHMVLEENDYKAYEAVEKLVMLASESDGEKEPPTGSMFNATTQPNMQAGPISIPTMPSHPSR